MISQGGLDGILDDESLMSSSGESSYDEDDQIESNQRQQQLNKNELISNKPISPLVGVDIESYAINHEIKNDEQINGLFSPKHNNNNNMNPPISIPSAATPMIQHQMNQNYTM